MFAKLCLKVYSIMLCLRSILLGKGVGERDVTDDESNVSTFFHINVLCTKYNIYSLMLQMARYIHSYSLSSSQWLSFFDYTMVEYADPLSPTSPQKVTLSSREEILLVTLIATVLLNLMLHTYLLYALEGMST